MAQSNVTVFDSLYGICAEVVSAYNERHPQQFTQAASISRADERGGRRVCTIQKNLEPAATLNWIFPINDGCINFTQSGYGVSGSGTAEIAISQTGVITYTIGDSVWSGEEFVEMMLKNLLFSKDTLKIDAKDVPAKSEVW